MKRIAVVGMALGLMVVLVWLGASLLSGSKAAAASNPGQRWEYLVVALGSNDGKAGNWCRKDARSFANDCKGTIKATTVYEWDHLTAKNPDGRSYESTEFQGYLDRLGLEGWELVTVVGMIGGDDQEFVFKRPLP